MAVRKGSSVWMRRRRRSLRRPGPGAGTTLRRRDVRCLRRCRAGADHAHRRWLCRPVLGSVPSSGRRVGLLRAECRYASHAATSRARGLRFHASGLKMAEELVRLRDDRSDDLRRDLRSARRWMGRRCRPGATARSVTAFAVPVSSISSRGSDDVGTQLSASPRRLRRRTSACSWLSPYMCN